MQFANNLIRISALAFGIAGALAVGNANAEAFQLKENSVKAAGPRHGRRGFCQGRRLGRGQQPGGHVHFHRTTVQADATRSTCPSNSRAAAPTALGKPLTGGDGGEAGGLNPVPAMSFVLPLSGGFEDLTVGAMVSAPFGLKTDYDKRLGGPLPRAGVGREASST